MATLKVEGENETLMQWVRDHGEAPETLTRRVDVNADGSVTFHRFALDPEGNRMAVETDVCQHCGRGDGGREWATEPVTVIPTRPFPITPEAL